MKKPILLFDFDGTIADTHEYIINISNSLAKEFNYKKIKDSEIEKLRDKTSQEIIKYLKVPILKIPTILSKAKKEFHRDAAHIKPFEGLIEILEQLKNIGIHMGIVSSNTSDNIKKFLKHNNLDMFDFIHSTSKVWSKNTSLKKLIAQKGFSLKETIYIGDEVRDIIAARKSGIRVACVTWGYNSKKALKEHEPDFIVHKPKELFGLCKMAI